jgi:hypothetical protein
MVYSFEIKPELVEKIRKINEKVKCICRYDKTLLAKMRTDYLLELEAKLDARIAMLSESARDKQEKKRLGKLMQELAAYDEKLNNKALGLMFLL